MEAQNPGFDREEFASRLRALKQQAPISDTAQRLDDALSRDRKWDCRISMGERELWDRAAQAVGVTTSEYVRAVVNHNAEMTIAEVYATTE